MRFAALNELHSRCQNCIKQLQLISVFDQASFSQLVQKLRQ